MKIIVGSAVKGLSLKVFVSEYLAKQGHEVVDVGCHNCDKFIKYTAVGERVAKAIQDGVAEVAINFCGSGTGAAMSAGKFHGVLACACESVATAAMIRTVNGANCLCLGENVVEPQLACDMADAFLQAKFQQAPGVSIEILTFWQEARDEMLAVGKNANPRELESL